MSVLQIVVLCCSMHTGFAELFPETVPQLKADDPLMPNEETSVKDCPFTVYPLGGFALASSIAADRYIDKSYSHTVKVVNGESTCVGLIVDEKHVLTTSECAPDDGPLPEVKLYNETLPPLETTEIFRNPDYNVTVLRLDSSIKLTILAVPTCFWDTPYDDGFEKIQNIFIAPNGTLSLEETKCSFQNRKDCLEALRKTDTIVQTRAIGQYRMHPFVFTFGSDDEGLALPVSKYIEWLGTVTEEKIKSSDCVSQYIEYREYEDSMVQRSDNYQSVQYSKSRLSSTSVSQYKVRIVPNTTETGSKRHCYGSLIAPKFILTAANCLHQYDVDSYIVEMGQQSVYYPVEDFGIRVRTLARKVHYHPEFNADTLENDIALLELVTPISEFNKTLVPACIWSQDKFPVNQFQTNGYVPFEETDEETVRTKQRYATADVLEECVEKVPQHKICAGFPTALAPNSCHNSIGSAMSRSLFSYDRFFEYIFAINSRGENCGFNMPTVYTVIAPYVQWIDSVIFADKVHYKDSTKYYGDRCKNGAGVEGTCVGLTQCPRLAEEVKSDQSSADVQTAAGSCSFEFADLTVCCTERDLLRNETYREQLAQATAEIDACPQLYHEFRKNKSPYKIDNFPTYPYLVRIHDEGEHSCNGTLISKQFVLTTAMCYRKLAEDKVTVVVGNSTKHNFSLHRAITHPQYSENPMEFNLVLLMLKTPVTVNNETIPACLWYNQTHTPLRLQEVYANPNYTHQYRYPLFNKECLRRNVANVTDLYLCVEKDSMFYQGFVRNNVDGGNALVSHFAQDVEEYQVTYLVGLFGTERTIEHKGNADDNDFGEIPPVRYYGVYQRISEYYSWIKHVIGVEMQHD
ncbi:uncharacterized protein LOC131284062 [Anopheles ziemanni]|uniref:uncharacterized protein LOC131260794 n=1 Tax=Anopheles coustani TaxID=139045 RepID=UPI002657E3F4|nr:uncharacterized protein LOC131260794 [Anopheles coustani]XP_058168900.1 uncharacterized protein LOC131284062 [Anopheles ziemanni]